MTIKIVFAVTMLWAIVGCIISSMVTNDIARDDSEKRVKAHRLALRTAIGSGILAALSLLGMIFV